MRVGVNDALRLSPRPPVAPCRDRYLTDMYLILTGGGMLKAGYSLALGLSKSIVTLLTHRACMLSPRLIRGAASGRLLLCGARSPLPFSSRFPRTTGAARAFPACPNSQPALNTARFGDVIPRDS